MDKELEELLNFEVSEDSSSEQDFTFQNEQFITQEEILTKSQELNLREQNEKIHQSDHKKLSFTKQNTNSLLDSNPDSNYKPKLLYQQSNIFELINKEITLYIEEKEQKNYSKDQDVIVFLNSSFVSNYTLKTISSSIQTTLFTMRNYYDVVISMMKRTNKNFPNLSKTTTFALGQNRYVAIGDFSGGIIIFDLIQKNIESILLDQYYATSLEFSQNLQFLFVGQINGIIKVFDTNTFIEIYQNDIFSKEIQQIISFGDQAFLVQDAGINMVLYYYQSQYYIYHTFTPKIIDFFYGKKITYMDIAQIQDIQNSTNIVIVLVCLDNDQLVLFQLHPIQKSLFVYDKPEKSKFLMLNFNRKNYNQSQNIFVQVLLQDTMQVFKIYQDDNNFYMQKIVSFQLKQKDNFLTHWLNDSILFVLPCDFKKIHLFNFQFIVDENVKKNDFLEKIEELEPVDFIIPQNFGQLQNYSKIQKYDSKQKRVLIIDFHGRILEIKLGLWKNYFEEEFKKNDFRNYLEQFWEVYEGQFCFFNDYIFDQDQRKKLMSIYLNEKIIQLSLQKFDELQKNLELLIGIYVKMGNFNIIFDSLKQIFWQNNEKNYFISIIEKFIRQNKIKLMPIQVFYEIADRFQEQNKIILIKQLIMNLYFQTDEIDIMMEYCMENKLFISMVSLGINSIPPQFGKLLNVLMNKIQSIENNETKSFLDKQLEDLQGQLKELDVRDITLWLFYYFIQKKLFDKEISQQSFDEFFETFFIVFINCGKAPLICYFNFKNFAILIMELFKQENFKLLKTRHHYRQQSDIQELKQTYKENIQQFQDDNDKQYLYQLRRRNLKF